MKNEIWKPVRGCPNYFASNKGRVKVIARIDARGHRQKEQILKPYGKQVQVHTRPIAMSVGRCMLLAFVGYPPKDKPIACHKDDDPWHNALTNLKWGSRKDNVQDMLRNGGIDRVSKGRTTKKQWRSGTYDHVDWSAAARLREARKRELRTC